MMSSSATDSQNIASKHEEKVVEFQGFVEQIASDVGLDASVSLKHEVRIFNHQLKDMYETLSSINQTSDNTAIKQHDESSVTQSKEYNIVEQNSSVTKQSESKKRLLIFQSHLLALSRNKPQLQSINKEQSIETLSEDEPSIVAVLHLWQHVFQETFQQYHELSSRLIRTQDVAAVLRLWKEHLNYVKEFLSSTVPSDMDRLTEYCNLCEIHQNLLTNQQNLILMVRSEQEQDISITEQFNTLTNLHNETLARIMEKHIEIKSRITSWECYRVNQRKLLSWLKYIDIDRSRLQLRFISLCNLEKIMQKINVLLEKLPSGEFLVDSLRKQQGILLINCDEILATSVKMELLASLQRISNIRASLITWRHFISRIKCLNNKREEQATKILSIFHQSNEFIVFTSDSIFSNKHEIQHLLDLFYQQKLNLIICAKELEDFKIITEQLGDYLSPSDMKSLNQQCFVLWQQHNDLDHQFSQLIYRFSERCSLYSQWENKSLKLLLWIKDAEKRLITYGFSQTEKSENLSGTDCEVQADIFLKKKEFEWIENKSLELLSTANSKEKERLENIFSEVKDSWKNLLTFENAGVNKIMNLEQAIKLIRNRLSEINTWVESVDNQISESNKLEYNCSHLLDKILQDCEYNQKILETESTKIRDILNLCDLFLDDCHSWNTCLNISDSRTELLDLEQKWNMISIKLYALKKKITSIDELLTTLNDIQQEYDGWLTKVEAKWKELDSNKNLNCDITKNQLYKLYEEIQENNGTFQMLKQYFEQVENGRLNSNTANLLAAENRKFINRWYKLISCISTTQNDVQSKQKLKHKFILAHGTAVITLTQIDIMLTQIEHLIMSEERKSNTNLFQHISSITQEISKIDGIVREADDLASQVMCKYHSDCVSSVQDLVEEYQSLWKNVKGRTNEIYIKVQKLKSQEYDNIISIDTLKQLEHDKAVQVNTLSMLKISIFDVYLTETELAILECKASLDSLENIIISESASINEISGNVIARLLRKCQSSIELVRYLHSLLPDEQKLTKAFEISTLVGRYEYILKQLQSRNSHTKEIKQDVNINNSLSMNHSFLKLEADLLNFETWLEFTEKLGEIDVPLPTEIEQLMEIIQSHNEFTLDIHAHKSIIPELSNIIQNFLTFHAEEAENLSALMDKLNSCKIKYYKIVETSSEQKRILKSALVNNEQFQIILEEVIVYLKEAKQSLESIEPIDLIDSSSTLENKYDKLKYLQSVLKLYEQRLLSLQACTDYLLERHDKKQKDVQVQIAILQSLSRISNTYIFKIKSILEFKEDCKISVPLGIPSQSVVVDAVYGITNANATDNITLDHNEQYYWTKGSNIFRRGIRASLPFQAFMLLLLGVATLLPPIEDNYSCMLSNNLIGSLAPIIQYPNGPPPL